MRGGRLGSRVNEGRSETRKVLRIARFRESMTIRMHRRPPVSLGACGTGRSAAGLAMERLVQEAKALALLDDVAGEETRRT